jgi:hypothetical protein
MLVTLMMEAICSSETSVLTRVKRRHNPEDGILYSYPYDNLKSYMLLQIFKISLITTNRLGSDTADVLFSLRHGIVCPTEFQPSWCPN